MGNLKKKSCLCKAEPINAHFWNEHFKGYGAILSYSRVLSFKKIEEVKLSCKMAISATKSCYKVSTSSP